MSEIEVVSVEVDDMPATLLAMTVDPLQQPGFATTIASYESELSARRWTEIELRKTLARKDDLLRQKDEFIQKQKELSTEADHRLMNNVQMISSLLSLQSHRTSRAEAALQLATAANRVATIGRLHRRLHSCDRWQRRSSKGCVRHQENPLLLSM